MVVVMLLEALSLPFLQRALVAAVLVGLAAPAVGIYLVQRRMALMGDGIGHIALTGVAVGLLTGTNPVWTAVLVASAGAIAIEVVRERGRTSGDVALAMLFYGGIAGGVVLVGFSDTSTTATLTSFLFGSLTSVPASDLAVMAVLTALVLGVTVGLRPALFALCQDEEHARVLGLPVRALNLLLAVTAAVTVTVALRVVGVLLVSALMVVPVATSQQLARGFRGTFTLALVLGVAVSATGVVASYSLDTAPGALIVVLAIAGFVVVTVGDALVRRAAGRRAAGPRPAPAEDDLVLAPAPPGGDHGPATGSRGVP